MLQWQSSGAVVVHAGKLVFPAVDAVPGLYRLLLGMTGSPDRVYFGETDNLRRRLTGNYRNPGPTQQTSLRINGLVLAALTGGGSVEVAVATSALVYLDGKLRPLDLTRKASRLLAESAALVHAHADGGTQIVNLG